MEYPKINSLYKRHLDGPDKNKLIVGDFSCEEFNTIKHWTVTEKVDGTNVRIVFDRLQPNLQFKGRTDNAQFPTFLLTYLMETFSFAKMSEVFKDSNYVILFGEGYGPKIQSGGYYRRDPGFILFDVFCSGWWFTRESVNEVAQNLGIDHCPMMNRTLDARLEEFDSWHKTKHLWSVEEICAYVQRKHKSTIAKVEVHEMEGIVARSEPQMMFRKGGPIMFKLKCKDFN